MLILQPICGFPKICSLKPSKVETKKTAVEPLTEFVFKQTWKVRKVFGLIHTGRAMQPKANGTCMREWECSHCTQATSKGLRSNLLARPVWMRPFWTSWIRKFCTSVPLAPCCSGSRLETGAIFFFFFFFILSSYRVNMTGGTMWKIVAVNPETTPECVFRIHSVLLKTNCFVLDRYCCCLCFSYCVNAPKILTIQEEHGYLSWQRLTARQIWMASSEHRWSQIHSRWDFRVLVQESFAGFAFSQFSVSGGGMALWSIAIPDSSGFVPVASVPCFLSRWQHDRMIFLNLCCSCCNSSNLCWFCQETKNKRKEEVNRIILVDLGSPVNKPFQKAPASTFLLNNIRVSCLDICSSVLHGTGFQHSVSFCSTNAWRSK